MKQSVSTGYPSNWQTGLSLFNFNNLLDTEIFCYLIRFALFNFNNLLDTDIFCYLIRFALFSISASICLAYRLKYLMVTHLSTEQTHSYLTLQFTKFYYIWHTVSTIQEHMFSFYLLTRISIYSLKCTRQ